MELDADAATVFGGHSGAVGESPYVVDAETFEEVVYADGGFHVGFVPHGCPPGIGRELNQVGVQVGVVFVAEFSPPSTEGKHLCELELLEEGDVVEDGSVGPVGEVP